jgi:hypothetical protein
MHFLQLYSLRIDIEAHRLTTANIRLCLHFYRIQETTCYCWLTAEELRVVFGHQKLYRSISKQRSRVQ